MEHPSSRVLCQLGQIGSNLQLNLGKLVVKGLILLLKSAFLVNTRPECALDAAAALEKPPKDISEGRENNPHGVCQVG